MLVKVEVKERNRFIDADLRFGKTHFPIDGYNLENLFLKKVHIALGNKV